MENNLLKCIILLAVILYVLSPIDGFPGPLDDLFVIVLGQVIQNRLSEEY